MLKLVVLACFSAGALLFTGCQEKVYYDPSNEPTDVGSDPSKQDFSTDRLVKLNQDYRLPKGVSFDYDLYSNNPLDANNNLRADAATFMVNGGGGFYQVGENSLRTIPYYVTELYAYSTHLAAPLLAYAKIENGVANFESVDLPEPVTTRSGIATRAGNAGNFGKKPVNIYLKERLDYYMETANGHYKYDLINPDLKKDIPAEVLTSIGQAFREGKHPDPKYIKDANLKVINDGPDGKGAKLYLSALYSRCSMKNSLSYFVYTGDKTDLSQLTPEEIEKLELINVFQLASANTNTSSSLKGVGLSPGAYTQLLYKNENGELVEEFPKGAIVGWRLAPSSFKDTETELLETIPSWATALFSVSSWNVDKVFTNNKTTDRPNDFTIYFSAKDYEGNVYNCFGFEDQKNNSDEDYNDLIFHVHSDPVDALDPPPAIQIEHSVKDVTHNGLLAFEDYWPQAFDYDLNDVVAKYSSKVTYVQTTTKNSNGDVIDVSKVKVGKVEDVFTFIHTGASYKNAFSYKVDIDPAKVQRVTIDGSDYTVIPDGDGFIIDLCPNVAGVITPMVYDVTPKVYTVVMEFVDGKVLEDGFAKLAAPYNPFIFPKPGVEIHLPMYKPTGRADKSLLGTQDDRSDELNKRWYVSGVNNKYPFAIHLAGDFEFVVPKEGEAISETYKQYTNWVESNMTENLDWYLHPTK